MVAINSVYVCSKVIGLSYIIIILLQCTNAMYMIILQR